VEQHNDLIARLDDRDEKTVSLEREGKHLERLKQEIYSAVPDLNGIVEMVTAREREDREERDRKVLRILKSKDQKVSELQGENSGLSRVIIQLRSQLEQLESANSELSRELEGTVHSNEERIRSLQAELNEERGRAAALQRTLEDMRHDEGEWAALKRQVSELLRQGDEAEKVRARLENDVEDLLRERTEHEGQVAAIEEKDRELKAQERKMAAMHRQMQEQADQLDCLVSELASRNGGELPIAFASLTSARDKDRTGEAETAADLKDQVRD
jgi:centlein